MPEIRVYLKSGYGTERCYIDQSEESNKDWYRLLRRKTLDGVDRALLKRLGIAIIQVSDPSNRP